MNIWEADADGGGSGVLSYGPGQPSLDLALHSRGYNRWFFSFSLLGQSRCHHATVPCGEPSPETGAAVGRYGLVLGDPAFLVCEEHLRCPHQAKAISACLVAGAALCQTLLTVQISGRDGAARVLSWGWGSPSPSHSSPRAPVESTTDPADGPGNAEGEWKGRRSVLFKNSKPLPPLPQVTKQGSAHLHPVSSHPAPVGPVAESGPLCVAGIQVVVPARSSRSCYVGLLLFLARVHGECSRPNCT